MSARLMKFESGGETTEEVDTKNAETKGDVDDAPADTRTLYEQLKEAKQTEAEKKKETFVEHMGVRPLNEDEVMFLQENEQALRMVEDSIASQDSVALSRFRTARQAEKAAAAKAAAARMSRPSFKLDSAVPKAKKSLAAQTKIRKRKRRSNSDPTLPPASDSSANSPTSHALPSTTTAADAEEPKEAVAGSGLGLGLVNYSSEEEDDS